MKGPQPGWQATYIVADRPAKTVLLPPPIVTNRWTEPPDMVGKLVVKVAIRSRAEAVIGTPPQASAGGRPAPECRIARFGWAVPPAVRT